MNRSTKLVLLLFIGYLSSSLSAQQYRPMAVEGATWIYSGWGEYEGESYKYFIEGDTLVENLSYKIVNQSSTITLSSGYFFIRDDIQNRKVFARNHNNGIFGTCADIENHPWDEEILLYDFDLEVGDSIELCVYGDYQLKINFTTYDLLFGENRRLLSVQDTIKFLDDITLIEGIGSPDGFPESLGLVIAAGLGFGLTEYCISDDGNCTTANENINQVDQVKIFPNPSTGLLNIETEKTIEQVRIYSMQGQMLLKSEGTTIDISPLEVGSYILDVRLSDNHSYRSKVLRN